MSRLSPSSIALLSGATLILVGSLYVAFRGDPSPDMPAVSNNGDDAGMTALPDGFLSGAELARPPLDLTLDHAALEPSGPLSPGEIAEPRAGASNRNDFLASSVRIDLAPQRFSDDEIVVRPYVGAGVDIDGAGEEGGFLGTDSLTADLKGKAEIGTKVTITKALEMTLGYEIQDTLGSTGGASSGLNHGAEERVHGGLSLKF